MYLTISDSRMLYGINVEISHSSWYGI